MFVLVELSFAARLMRGHAMIIILGLMFVVRLSAIRVLNIR